MDSYASSRASESAGADLHQEWHSHAASGGQPLSAHRAERPLPDRCQSYELSS